MKAETDTVLVKLRTVQMYRPSVGSWFSALSDCSVGKDPRASLVAASWHCPITPHLLLPCQAVPVTWLADPQFVSEEITGGTPTLMVLLKDGALRSSSVQL